MLPMSLIRKRTDEVQQVANAKGIEISIEELLQTDTSRKQLLHELELLRSERNRLSKLVGVSQGRGEAVDLEQIRVEVRKIHEQLQVVQEQYDKIQGKFEELMLRVPNIVADDTPCGKSESDNVELRRGGEPPQFSFRAMDHVELMERHHMLELRRGVKVAGTRGYFLTGVGVELHRAVQQLALDFLSERGFVSVDVPLIVREKALVDAGFFPLGRDQTYHIEDDKWLVGTSEASLVGLYAGDVLEGPLPVRLAAVSSCFRSEVGSAGRDVSGIYRVHQFAKVEQVVLCRNNVTESEQMLEAITRNGEELLQLLELPYRVVRVCSGDLSQKNYKQYDIETWMPCFHQYRETHSASLLLDFQARRANIRYRDEDGNMQYCHTLNNTAVASPRILIPLLENHQQEDGSIRIPKALRSYLKGRTVIS